MVEKKKGGSKKDGSSKAVKRKIQVRQLGKTPSKDLTDDELGKVSGGTRRQCPGTCSTLVVVTARTTLTVDTACLGEGTGPLVVKVGPKR